MDVNIVNTIIFKGMEYAIIGIKYISASDKLNPFLLECLDISRGEILIGDYVRSIHARWIIDQNELQLKELIYKQNAFIFSGLGAQDITTAEDSGLETATMLYGYEFTGRLRIARDIMEGCIIENEESPLAYRTVIDITVNKDEVVGVIDRSQEVEEWRRGLEKNGYERVLPIVDL